jgi:hypothetical protein
MKDVILIAAVTISIFLGLKLQFRPTLKAVESEPISSDDYVQTENNQNEKPTLNSEAASPKAQAVAPSQIKNENLSEDQIALRELIRPETSEKMIHCDPDFRNTDDINTLREKQKIIASLIEEKSKEEIANSVDQLSHTERTELEEYQKKIQLQSHENPR